MGGIYIKLKGKITEMLRYLVDREQFFRDVDLVRKNISIKNFRSYKKRWLLDSNIKTVIDIGAYKGEFAAIFAELFPDARIYSFEPLPDCFEQLKQVANKYSNVKIFNIALGDGEGSFEFHRSSWAPSSSFREMTELHKKNYPHSAGIEKTTIQITTLDKILQNEILKKNILIKIDVQGFEDAVIKGGQNIISRAKFMVIETSYQQLYKNEPMFDGIYSIMNSMGFKFMGTLKQSVRKADDSYLQADCIYINRNPI